MEEQQTKRTILILLTVILSLAFLVLVGFATWLWWVNEVWLKNSRSSSFLALPYAQALRPNCKPTGPEAGEELSGPTGPREGCLSPFPASILWDSA
jgi:hypothetical protein